MSPSSRPRSLLATERRIEMELSPGRGAPPRARRCMDRLRGSIPDPVFDDLLVITTELVSNSVLHAGLTPEQVIVVRVEVGEAFTRLDVEDPGQGFSPRPVPRELGGSGRRGLVLVDRIAARWGILRTDVTHVWAEIDHRP